MENENLTISCSPGTYNRVKNDKDYMLKVTHDVLAEQGCSYSQVTFTQTAHSESGKPLECDVPEQTEKENAWQEDIFVPITDSPNENKLNWHDAPTKLMLALVEELRPKLGKSVLVKTKGRMYKLISQRMEKEGYRFTPVQIENKFRGLERNYKKTVLHNRQTGRNRQTCCYETELDKILKGKKGINPEYVLDSADVAGCSHSSGPIDDNSDTDHSVRDNLESPSQLAGKTSKLSARGKLMAKMGEMVEERKNFHSKVLEFLEKRAQKREEISKRKLELLEMLVDKKK